MPKANSDKIMFYGTGRRKCSIAVAKVSSGKGRVFVNGKTLRGYFGNRPSLEMTIFRPLVLTDNQDKLDVNVKTLGGGVSAQADAIKHAISRALLSMNEEYKPILKQEGLLTRDARIKERKKPGLKKARRSPQFSKR